MHQKMIILLACLAMAVSVAQATVSPCPISSNTPQGLQNAADTTMSNCQSSIASCPGGGGGLLDLLNGTIKGLLNKIVAALGKLLNTVLNLVVKLLNQVLALLSQVINLATNLLNGLLGSSQYKSSLKNWYSNGCSQMNSYQGTALSGVLSLVQQLLNSLGNGCGALVNLDLDVAGGLIDLTATIG